MKIGVGGSLIVANNMSKPREFFPNILEFLADPGKVIVIKNFLNLEGHQNPIIGSKVTAILLKGWISPIGGALPVEGL